LYSETGAPVGFPPPTAVRADESRCAAGQQKLRFAVNDTLGIEPECVP